MTKKKTLKADQKKVTNAENKTAGRYYNMDNRDLDVMNPSTRGPVALLLDTSGSMRGAPLQELKKALYTFIKDMKEDIAANSSVELCIITLDENATTVLPFTCVNDLAAVMLDLKAAGGTYMGKALDKARNEIIARRHSYQQSGIPSYAPWVVLMTDGRPGDKWEIPAQEMLKMAKKLKMQYIGVGIGAKANHKLLTKILPPPGPVTLSHVRFKDFFRWLSDSLTAVSASCISDEKNVLAVSWQDLF